jgi:NTP pyrophosphatase (non-canonical NTP hydrolase)
MKCSLATVGRMELDDYVRLVPQIYGAHDRHRSISDVWCHTLHHGAAVAEQIRKNAPADKLFTEIADLALWLFTVVQKLSGRPGKRKTPSESVAETFVRIRGGCSEIVWQRYPGVCHLCYARRAASKQRGIGLRRPCDCSQQGRDMRDKAAKRADLKALRKFSASVRGQKPKSIDDWQTMLAAIFTGEIRRLSPVEIGFHLLEELGEVSDAMARMYSYAESNFRPGEPSWRQARLEDQIADAFSWLFALVNKLNAMKLSRYEHRRREKNTQMGSGAQITLSEIIWRRYGSDKLKSFRCPSCGSSICSCPLVFVPGTHPVKELLEKFKPSGLR